MSSLLNSLWVEKYRAQKLDDLVLSTENRSYFQSIKTEIPNLLFIGSPGLGKTSLARIIVQDILKCQYLYINSSDENGIDVIRNKIISFAQTKSVDGGIKVVVIDEADALSLDAQRALRNTMEEYSDYTRFILTANYKHKIIPALQSRSQSFDFNPLITDVLKRVFYILTTEKIKIVDEQKKKLAQIVKDNYPDIRRIINITQKYSISGEFIVTSINAATEIVKNIHQYLVNKKVLDLRKYLIENEIEFQGDYGNLLKRYLDYVYQNNLKDDIKRQAVIIISEYLYRDIFVTDKEINAFACFCQLEKVI